MMEIYFPTLKSTYFISDGDDNSSAVVIALGVALGVAVLALVIVVGVLCLKMGRN